eukprot:GHVO01015549.1.p1 GENE.GHVO01015549.1~~GHVO01015549.1.p1  ORF type:complete len:204 (+),score=17.53 GHVO01015549.1:989-1600(+)
MRSIEASIETRREELNEHLSVYDIPYFLIWTFTRGRVFNGAGDPTPFSPLLMSSLAGALISPETTSPVSQAPNNNLQPQSNLDIKPKYQDEDQEMTDLFGGEAEVGHTTREECVPRPISFFLFSTSSRRQVSPSDTTEGSERLGSAEAEQRRALEYGEDEVPPELAFEEREANVAFPNLPMPSSSDKDVCRFHSVQRADLMSA